MANKILGSAAQSRNSIRQAVASSGVLRPANLCSETGPVAPSEIPAQIDRLGVAVDQLHTAVQALYERLRPVIGQELEAAVLPDGVGSMSPIGQRVEYETDRLFNEVRAIEALTGSLAI